MKIKLSRKMLFALALLPTLFIIMSIGLGAWLTNIRPTSNRTYDIGSSMYFYRDAYFSRVVKGGNFTASEYFIGDGSLLTGLVAAGNTSQEMIDAINGSGSLNITAWATLYIDNATERDLFLSTFNSTYDLKVDNPATADLNMGAYNITNATLINATDEIRINGTEVEAHRKWGWSDESSWSHQLYLPFVYKHNLSIGKIIWYNKSVDGKFDSDNVQHPCVLYVDDVYYLFYSGYNGTHWQIGVLNATSPEGTYTRMNNGEPIIVAGGTYDTTRAWLPTGCMYDETESNPAMRYKIWYMGFTNGANTATALWAYNSEPGSVFTKGGQVTGLNTPAWGQSVVKFGNLYVNLYSSRAGATYSFKLAVSPNASDFKDLGTIMSLGSSGAWDDYFIGMGSLFWNSGVNYLLYQGQGDSVPIGLGLATTWGLPQRTLEKFNVNPILEFPDKGSTTRSGWDETQGGCMMQIEDKFYIWYHAANDTAGNQSFVVTHIP